MKFLGRIPTAENCRGEMKPSPVVGSSAGGAAVGIFPSLFPYPILSEGLSPSGVSPGPSRGHGRKARSTWLCYVGAHKLETSGCRQEESRAEGRLPSLGGCPPAEAQKLLMPCTLRCAGRAGICSKRFKNNIPNQGKCCSLAYFSKRSKSASEKEVGELCLEENFHNNLQLSLF